MDGPEAAAPDLPVFNSENTEMEAVGGAFPLLALAYSGRGGLLAETFSILAFNFVLFFLSTFLASFALLLATQSLSTSLSSS